MFAISGRVSRAQLFCVPTVEKNKNWQKRKAEKVEFLIKDDLISHLEVPTSPKSLPGVQAGDPFALRSILTPGDERRVLVCCHKRI